MELLNPTSLWKDYDRHALPLDASVVSVRADKGVTTERIYFTGLTAPDGVARVYARLVYPEGCDFSLVAVVMGEEDRSVDGLEARLADEVGAAVLFVDYSGVKPCERYTLYPPSLAYAEPGKTPDTFSALPDSPRNTCWYVWTVVMLRAAAYAESRFAGCRLLLLGVGCGGAQAVKAATLVDTVCTVTVGVSRTEIKDLAFKASLSSESYTSKIEAPLLMLCGSNALYDGADRVSESYKAGARRTRIYIRPRAFGGITREETEDIGYFILCAARKKFVLPECPAIEAHSSDETMYCEITARGADSVKLYAAQSIETGALRNWHELPAESAGDTFLARVGIYSVTEPVYLLAVARYGTLTLSSPIVSASPDKLGVKSDTVSRSRLVYDSEMGEDDWVSGQGERPVVMRTGALGIDGVSAERTLSIFKIGDCAYRAQSGDVLQILVYSEVRQAAALFAVSRTGGRFIARRELSPFDGWTKLTLSPNELKSRDGTLGSWADAACFGVEAESPVLVNSMLWV